jgi:glycosyltransferase involved in cell wall biosynthesis
MSCGLPVVTMDYPENGTKDVVRTFDSGLITETNPAAFAAGISRVTARWELYSENGLAAAKSLDWDVVAERLEGELEAAISKTGVRPIAARPGSRTQPA